MPRGNAADPFGRNGIDFGGSGDDLDVSGSHRSTKADMGDQFRRGSIDGSKRDRRGLARENGYSDEQTKLDRDVRASDARVRASSDSEWVPDAWFNVRGRPQK